MTAGLDRDTLRDRFRGTLLGLAVREALGAPAPVRTPKQIVERYGVITDIIGGGCHDVAPSETTDATEMMLGLAESLADNRDSILKTSWNATVSGLRAPRAT
jgi:ADP-ribosylglycohydrolase